MRVSLGAATALAGVGLLVALVSPHTVFVFIWWGLVVAVVSGFGFGRRDASPALAVYALYALLAVVMFQAQLWTNPGYYGFSGGHGVGTDDSFFYSLVAYDLPFDFPTRFAVALQRHNYGDVLKALVAVHRRIFPGLHPLDLLLFNVAVLTFLPFVAGRIYDEVFGADRGRRWAVGMMVAAPFVLANGVILMRDGLVATVLAGGLLAVMRRRWFVFALLLAATGWLRLQNGVMLAGMGAVIGLTYPGISADGTRWRRADGPLRSTLQGVGLLAVALLVVQAVWQVPWWEWIYRGDFLRNTIGQSASQDQGTSTFYAVSQLPAVVRVPTALLFYIGSPFLSLASLRVDGLWVPRNFLVGFYALAFPFYAAFFYRAVARILRERQLRAAILLVLFLVGLGLVSQASMQLRHKIPLQPLFYVLVAWGVGTPHHQDRSLGWLVALLVIAANAAVNILALVG